MKRYSRKQIITVSVVGCILLLLIFGHNYMYSNQQKIEQFKEDYFRYNDYYRQLVSTVNSLEIEESKYKISWSYKGNKATFSDMNNDPIVVDAQTEQDITKVMEHDMEVIFVTDSLLKIVYRNSTNYSDLTFCSGLFDFPVAAQFQNFTVYSDSLYPHRFETGWVYKLSNSTLLYK